MAQLRRGVKKKFVKKRYDIDVTWFKDYLWYDMLRMMFGLCMALWCRSVFCMVCFWWQRAFLISSNFYGSDVNTSKGCLLADSKFLVPGTFQEVCAFSATLGSKHERFIVKTSRMTCGTRNSYVVCHVCPLPNALLPKKTKTKKEMERVQASSFEASLASMVFGFHAGLWPC